MADLSKFKVLVDPGHGGTDPGANHGGVDEAKINLDISRHLLIALGALGIEATATRHSDFTVDLANRVQIEHLTEPDLLISLHCNSFTSPGAHGLEIFTSPGETLADMAATLIAKNLQAEFPASRWRGDYSDDDPDKEENFYMLTATLCPAVLVEMGFLSNPRERGWLCMEKTHGKIADAIALGVLEYTRKLVEGAA